MVVIQSLSYLRKNARLQLNRLYLGQMLNKMVSSKPEQTIVLFISKQTDDDDKQHSPLPVLSLSSSQKVVFFSNDKCNHTCATLILIKVNFRAQIYSDN